MSYTSISAKKDEKDRISALHEKYGGDLRVGEFILQCVEQQCETIDGDTQEQSNSTESEVENADNILDILQTNNELLTELLKSEDNSNTQNDIEEKNDDLEEIKSQLDENTRTVQNIEQTLENITDR